MNIKRLFSTALIIALYTLPVLFFIAVYFLQVVSSEDIYQGAGQPASIIHDALSAFGWSARFGDMYAWSTINFFDYTYSFGIDTIFRFIDVLLAVGLFYLITIHVLGRRPQWQVSDSLIFGTSFLVLFLSDYSRSIVSGFSHIHNYLFIAVFSLLFLLPFTLQLRGRPISSRLRNKVLLCTVGFLFAFSSNVTPAAFLITASLMVAYERVVLKRGFHLSGVLRSWQFFGVAGMTIAFYIMYLLGPGFSSYTHGYNPSFVSLSALLATPGNSVVGLISNTVHNVQSVMPEFIVMGLVVLFEYLIYKKKLTPKGQNSLGGLRFSIACFIFFSVHTLAVSQINISGMTRLLLPAYICTIIAVLFTLNRIAQIVAVKDKALMIIAVPIVLLISVVTVDVGMLMVKHQHEATQVLDRIKYSEGSMACVRPEDNPRATSLLLKYHQRELFVDWAMPATIYSKQVSWCHP